MSDTRCCCGKEMLADGEPLVINDYMHEPLDMMNVGHNFCGPRIKHEVRDLDNELTQAKALLKECDSVYSKFLDWNTKYPSSRVFSHTEIVKIAEQLDEIMGEAEELLTKIRGM